MSFLGAKLMSCQNLPVSRSCITTTDCPLSAKFKMAATNLVNLGMSHLQRLIFENLRPNSRVIGVCF